ncbi:hypothetical protein TNIN_202481 [Trichonephila inaurata madagascariensis]|uniref:Uncharacterized protein n=1 Tax=Trichonephila inaurata madagascariensis TaxID=2747483 RepID=A0A8X6YJS6_9ARAC|nr:hypothetical protein TNIN_202481 [Trichonephila inaurata madagascariensis]
MKPHIKQFENGHNVQTLHRLFVYMFFLDRDVLRTHSSHCENLRPLASALDDDRRHSDHLPSPKPARDRRVQKSNIVWTSLGPRIGNTQKLLTPSS